VLEIMVPGASGPGPNGSPSPGRGTDRLDRAEYLRVLQQTGWRIRGKRGAAEMLGLKPTTLETRMAKLGIRRP
jgi:transcriptional regulator with GAF, ATPase, and Fis domain